VVKKVFVEHCCVADWPMLASRKEMQESSWVIDLFKILLLFQKNKEITQKLEDRKEEYKEYGCGEVYSIQHYVIKFVSDLLQVSGFLRILRFPPPIKLTARI
jgi:hypothetical protein